MPHAEDERKDFILHTAASAFGIGNVEDVSDSIYNSDEVDAFLDDTNANVLYLRHVPGEKKILVFNSTSAPEDGGDNHSLLLMKLQPKPITPQNMRECIQSMSMNDSPVSTFYHALNKVFAPLLLRDAKWSRKIDPKLQSLVSDLEAGLGSALRHAEPEASSKSHNGKGSKGRRGSDESDADSDDDKKKGKNANVNKFVGIQLPSQEIEYWAERQSQGSSTIARQQAVFFLRDSPADRKGPYRSEVSDEITPLLKECSIPLPFCCVQV
eukprot:Opistho-2@29072